MPEFTRARARALCRRRLMTMKRSIIAMAGHWDDLDMGIVRDLEDLALDIDLLLEAMDESVEEEALNR